MSNRLTTVVVLMLLSAPSAFALNARSAVSVNGSDINSCTVASPCRSFTTAIAQTIAGGEVIALDSAGYGPFTIAGSFTVSGAPGIHAAITVTGNGTGILVNGSSTDRVTLRNLVLINSGGHRGIQQVQANELRILNCLIRGFVIGIDVTAGRLTVDHCTVLDQVTDGNAIGINLNSNGTDAIQMTLENSLIEGNDIGVNVSGRSSAMITSCTISSNDNYGVFVGSTLGPARATIESTTVAYNQFGITVFAGVDATAVIYLAQDEISYSAGQGVVFGGKGMIYTFNNNRFTENALDGGPLTPFAFK